MREIKFRVWDTQLYVMFDDKKDAELGDAYEPLWNLKCVRGGKLSYPLGIIMQYTGLKDKNGKEIYEGDIVLYKKLISVVEWMWYMWIFKHKDMGDMAQDHVVASSHSSVKIIGNIHENPDLL